MKIRLKMQSLSSGEHFPHYTSMGDYRTSYSHVNSQIYPKTELGQDFMAVLFACKSDEDSIKNEMVIHTTFS